MNRYEEAARALAKSAELNHRNIDAHVFLGEALIRMERWTEARQAFQAAVELNQQNLRAHAGLVRSLEMQGRLHEALDALKNGIDEMVRLGRAESARALQRRTFGE